MKHLSSYTSILLLFIVFACVKDREMEMSLLLGNIDALEISVDENVFVVQEGTKLLDLKVKFLDPSGNELSIGDDIKTEIWINDSLRTIAEIDLSEAQIYEVRIAYPALGELTSNTLDIFVLPLESAVKQIEIELKDLQTIFIKGIDTLDFTSYLDVIITDSVGNTHPLDTQRHTFDIVVNGQKIDSRKLKDFQEGPASIVLEMGGKKSSAVEIEVYTFENAINNIAIEIHEHNNVFIKYEDVLDFVSYLDVVITDIVGNQHALDTINHPFDLLVDGQIIASRKVYDFPAGHLELNITIGQTASNLLNIEVLDPTTGIKNIELEFSDDTSNPYTLVGKTSYNFEYTVWDFDNTEVNVNIFQLNVNELVYDRLTDIPIDEAGEFKVQLVAHGVKSNVITITSREDQSMGVNTLPIIFHIVHNGDVVGTTENRSASDVQTELNLINAAFDNTHKTSTTKSINAVNSYIRFELADKDPNGNTLTEQGIHRMQVATDQFETFAAGTKEFMFDNMWDPDSYINVFVLNVDDHYSYAFFPTLFQMHLDGVNNTTNENFELNYYYGVMFNNTHFGSANSVLAHELGHYMGLAHTWVDESAGNCFNSDYANDTQDYVNTNASLDGEFRFDCEGKRFLSTNFMDYNSGKYNSFTYDQRVRMHTVIDHALFFPRDPSAGGRQFGLRKGTLDLSIKPIRCNFEVQMN